MFIALVVLLVVFVIAFILFLIWTRRMNLETFKSYCQKKVKRIAKRNDLLSIADLSISNYESEKLLINHVIFGKKYIYLISDFMLKGFVSGEANDNSWVYYNNIKKTTTEVVTGSSAYVGIYMVNLNDVNSVDYYELDDVETTLKKGVVVESVIPGTPAASVLKRGDIIVGFNDADIENMNDFTRELSKHSSGNRVTFTIERNGRIRNVKLVLSSK